MGLNFVLYKSLKEWLIRTKPFGLVEDSKLSVTRLACDVEKIVDWKDAASIITSNVRVWSPF